MLGYVITVSDGRTIQVKGRDALVTQPTVKGMTRVVDDLKPGDGVHVHGRGGDGDRNGPGSHIHGNNELVHSPAVMWTTPRHGRAFPGFVGSHR